MMRISIAYALPEQQVWMDLDLPEYATVISAINRSGLQELFPEIQLDQQKVGIFGKLATLETRLVEGDRVEIYRPTTWLPPEDDDDDE
ncbi:MULTISPECIES: RnfH family protein [Corallincola]|nr:MULTISPECIES: RnfH family protein [Corallincola]